MRQEIRLHGQINDTIEYFATASAWDAFRGYFYEATGDSLRLFSPGNELVLDENEISHYGNGGTFCEYMFGVDQPLSDLAKSDVRNRLVLYGGTYQTGGQLIFSDQTDGTLSYERIFLEGNAVYNHFFFLTGSVSGSTREQQEDILRLLGKLLKRSTYVGVDDDYPLIEEISSLLGHKSSLYVVKLLHRRHRLYHDHFRELYFEYKTIPDEKMTELQQLADRLGIDKYQQERIRIDVMYKHEENRRIVDEYKNILIECGRKERISKLENARLTRLKTLAVRHKIPTPLFYTLDSMLKHDKMVEVEEQGYISETREILAGIFFTEHQLGPGIVHEDMLRLLEAKRQASENRDHTFEQILLETGKACDEMIRDGADISLLENFSYVITYFDRYDNTSAHINKLAFMENSRFSEEIIRSLLGNRTAFNELDDTLFGRLFFDSIFDNKYIGKYGKKKLKTLLKGLDEIADSRNTVQGLITHLQSIESEENLYELLLTHVKERIRNFYSRYTTRKEQEDLLAEITEELRNKNLINEDIPYSLFNDVVVNIKKEAIYLHNLLPRIVAERDIALREDFLENSGLDRFYVEELEREYFELNNLDLNELYQIRKGLNTDQG
ncbi:MAG: TIGR04442 family protein [Desulfuromonadaceae bacterium]|nr:TIGR04442 family protein [Desulfuromonadaceae bacterium]